jgi:tetratricopeptide (TPR) repeat protein
VKQFEKWGWTEHFLSDHAKKDSVFARGEEVASDLVKRYKSRPEPLEARSSMRLVRTLLSASPSVKMLDSVESDLRAVVDRHLGSSVAFTRLSAVLEYKGQLQEARAVADEAARRDDFLANDKDNLFRQFRLAFELRDDETAQKYCLDLEHRYPNETPSSFCRLMLMGWSETIAPDTAAALHIVRTGAADEPDGMRKLTIARFECLSAAVFKRIGQTERAREILRERERSTDPELVHIRAAVLARLGDLAAARALARQFAAQNDLQELAIRRGRIYRGLLDDSTPGSQELP